MSATSIDPEREDAARDPFAAELQALKRENRQHRRALDGIVAEIHARMAESPRQQLANDLLQLIVGEQLVTYEGRDGSPAWQQLPDLAEKCLEAAGKIYPEPEASGVPGPEFWEWLRSQFTFIDDCRENIPPPPHKTAVTDHEAEKDDDEPRDPGAHPGVMLDRPVAEYSADDRLYDEENS